MPGCHPVVCMPVFFNSSIECIKMSEIFTVLGVETFLINPLDAENSGHFLYLFKRLNIVKTKKYDKEIKSHGYDLVCVHRSHLLQKEIGNDDAQ